jgi:hypothetical protein
MACVLDLLSNNITIIRLSLTVCVCVRVCVDATITALRQRQRAGKDLPAPPQEAPPDDGRQR